MQNKSWEVLKKCKNFKRYIKTEKQIKKKNLIENKSKKIILNLLKNKKI